MEIDSRFAGTKLESCERTLHWRDMMVYAAGVDDRNPIYYDDEREGGIVGHPLFPVVVTWPILQHLSDYMPGSSFPFHLLAAQSHYAEHLVLHRSLRSGDTLTIDGKIAAIVPHTAGTRLVIRLAGNDRQARPVFTRFVSLLLRGIQCSDEGTGAGEIPLVPAPPDKAEILWQAVVAIGPLRPYIYDGCTSISMLQHLSRRFAHGLELPGIVLQETATLAFALRELLYREAEGEPRGLEILSCRFTGIVLPNTEIRIQLLGKKPHAQGTDLHFVVLNHQDRRVISDGYAFVRREGLIP